MFTVRLERHASGKYDVLSCQRYSVSESECGTQEIASRFKEIRLFRSLDDDDPHFEFIGPEQMYAVAFITNSAGKTIDRIT